MRLSQARIPTLLVVGNHDISPSVGRANTLHEFDTLQVSYVRVIQEPCLLKPGDIWNVPLQVIGIPWVTRSALMAAMQSAGESTDKSLEEAESIITRVVNRLLDAADLTLPLILTAHASVQGAMFGNERSVMLGNDMILPGSLVRDRRVDYSALGHIHRAQDVNQGSQPPVVYPGSIERVDFNEVADDKCFVIAKVEKGSTQVEFRKLNGRKFFDKSLKFSGKEDRQEFMTMIQKALPSREQMKEAIGRLVIEYPREWEPLLDEPAIRKEAESAFEFHLVRKPVAEARLRLPAGQVWNELTPLDLFEKYLQTVNTSSKDIERLITLADGVIKSTKGEGD